MRDVAERDLFWERGMRRGIYEVRDPIHTFVHFDARERDVINSRAFQRLRHIHQLGMSHFVYPGANHTRFEHALGVMELAARVFERITRDDLLTDQVRDLVPELADQYQREHWLRTLRMAALCHDLGHLPFSHAAETELLPDGWNHERLTVELIHSDELAHIWEDSPPLNPDEIAKLAVGPSQVNDSSPKNVEAVLSEVITGETFGVDRIDYLIRDSYHAGVAYGRFDHYRLIDTLQLLPPAPYHGDRSQEPALGIERGGIHSAEALLLARYFMFKQVYFHHVRRIYDIHLQDFMALWLPEGRCPVDLDGFLALTDNEVTAGLLDAAYSGGDELGEHARRIVCRRHFRRVYEPSREDLEATLDPTGEIYAALRNRFGSEAVRHDRITRASEDISEPLEAPEFPVLFDEQSVSSVGVSDVLAKVPEATVDCIYVHPDLREEAREWLVTKKRDILGGGGDGEDEPT